MEDSDICTYRLRVCNILLGYFVINRAKNTANERKIKIFTGQEKLYKLVIML